MAQTCSKCSRMNPGEASYCYYDGSLLEGHSQNGGGVRAGTQSFASHFVFPSGLICRNFDQLAQACQESWTQAVELLQEGYLERFLGGLGRADLAFAAREASRFPDRDRGLDQLLAKLPTQVLEPPKLHVEPREVNLGIIQVGDNRHFELHLANNGSRLLYGTVTSDDCKWLTLGDAPGMSQKVFQFGSEMSIPVQVRGANLRAGNKPLEGRLLVESNGGNTTIVVRCEVPVKPFTEGVLAGAKSPRQIAEKAKAAPKDAAVLFERGAVADWYKANGWTYPVQGPSAAGLGAVQQFFEALGLTAPPKVEINEKFINFHGNVGAHLKHTLEVKAQEKRPVFAHGTSDQPWIVVERAQLNGRTATIGVTIPSVPNRPGEVLQGRVTVTSNGNQRFVVPVNLNVSGSYGQPVIMMEEAVTVEPVFADVEPVSPIAVAPILVAPPPPPHTIRPPSHPEFAPAAPMVLMDEPGAAPMATPRMRGRGTSIWVHLIPAFGLAIALLIVIILDMLQKKEVDAEYPIYPEPMVQVEFLDHPIEIQGRRDDNLGGTSLRFGFVIPHEKDPNPNPIENPGGKKRLTYFANGTSNNTVIRIDGQETLLGSTPRGHWKADNKQRILYPLGKTKDGRKRDGFKSVFIYDEEKIQVTQIVEVIPNDQPTEKEYKGKNQEVRLLDTVLVRYEIENKDRLKHQVGIRFLLDTFIGTNDGVPFTIPGEKDLCDTKKEFDPAKGQQIPDYIQALEIPPGKPKSPGTVAHLALKIPGLEVPSRVTLGAWPHHSLKDLDTKARGHMTMWEVPFLDMQAGNRSDSAVTMYWNDKELASQQVDSKAKRVVGFAYGLGDFAGSGKIGLSTGGDFAVGGTFTVTALINDPKGGETATIKLPAGFELVEGKATQNVPLVQAGAKSNNSPVTWKVKATETGKKRITVTTSTGASQSKAVLIMSQSGIF